jgi:hypothetical protein
LVGVWLREGGYRRLRLELQWKNLKKETGALVFLLNIVEGSRSPWKLYTVEETANIFEPSNQARSHFGFSLYGITEQEESAGETRLLLAELSLTSLDLSELFQVLADPYALVPFPCWLKSPPVLLLYEHPPAEDPESEGCLLDHLKESPQFSIFAKNPDLNPYLDPDEEDNKENVMRKIDFVLSKKESLTQPAPAVQTPSIKTASMISCIRADPKLNLLLFDYSTFPYTTKEQDNRNRLDALYQQSVQWVAMPASTVQPGPRNNPMRFKSSMMQDIAILRAEDKIVENFVLRLNPELVRKWQQLETVDEYHRLLNRAVGFLPNRQSLRYKRTELLRRRVAIFTNLFFNILHEYYYREGRRPQGLNLLKPMDLEYISEPADVNQIEQGISLNPLLSLNFSGLHRDHCTLQVFLANHCPLLSALIGHRYPEAALVVCLSVLSVLCDLLSSHGLHKLIQIMTEDKERGRLWPLLALAMSFKMIEQQLANEEPSGHLSNCKAASFTEYLRQWLELNETALFASISELRKQTASSKPHRWFLDDLMAGVRANLEPHPATTIESIISKVEASKLGSGERWATVVQNSLCVKLVGLARSLQTPVDELARTVVAVRRPVCQFHVFVRVNRVFVYRPRQAEGPAGGGETEVREDRHENSKYKLRMGMEGGEESWQELPANEAGAGKTAEFTMRGEAPKGLVLEVLRIEEWCVYRSLKSETLGSCAVHLANCRRNHPVGFVVRVKDQTCTEDEFWVELTIYVVENEILGGIGSKPRKKFEIFEDNDNFELDTNRTKIVVDQSLVLDRGEPKSPAQGTENWTYALMVEPGYIQFESMKFNVSVFECLVNSKVVHWKQYVCHFTDEQKRHYNLWNEEDKFEFAAVSYTEIVRNVSNLPQVQNIKVSTDCIETTLLTTWSVTVRLLLFSGKLDQLIDYLFFIFQGRDGSIGASELVFFMDTVYRISNVRPRQFELISQIELSLGKHLAFKIESCGCFLFRNMRQSELSESMAWNGSKASEFIDIKTVVLEMLHWLNLKYNSCLLILGDGTDLFVLREILQRLNTDLSEISGGRLVLRLRLDGLLFERSLHFDEGLRVQARRRGAEEEPMDEWPITRLMDFYDQTINLGAVESVRVSRLEVDRLVEGSALFDYLRDNTPAAV